MFTIPWEVQMSMLSTYPLYMSIKSDFVDMSVTMHNQEADRIKRNKREFARHNKRIMAQHIEQVRSGNWNLVSFKRAFQAI